MKTKIVIFSSLFIGILAVTVPDTFGQIEKNTPTTTIPITTVEQSENVKDTISSYETLLNDGKFLDAKEELLKLITSTKTGIEKESLQKKLYDLNIKILFSKVVTSNSVFYTVVEGDTLGKIARKHKTTVALIKESNGLESDLIRPKQKLKIFSGTFKVKVDKSDNKLFLFGDDELLKAYTVATGENNSSPVGTFKVNSKLENPTWYRTGAIIPPDSPENILGTRWIGFDLEGYGIHGTTIPESIGTQSTAGCVRMLNDEVEELFSIIPYGTEVEIID